MHRRRFVSGTLQAGALLAVAGVTGAAPAAGGVLRRSRGGNLTSLDPHRPISATDMEIAPDLFVGLTAIDASGAIVPGCARDWSISADGRRYEFRLRAGLVWSDGRPLTAEDAVASLRRLLSPATAALLAYRYDAIRGARALREGKATAESLGVRTIGADRVVIDLDRAETDLLKLLAVAYLVPTHVIAANGRDWAKPPGIVVNGPWRPVNWAQNGTLALEANPRWHAAGTQPVIRRLEWVMGIDDAARLRAFRTGDLDVVQIGEPAQFAIARRELGARLHSVPFYGGGWVGLNLRRPALREQRFREMLALAVDRQVITAKVRQLGESPSESLVPIAVTDYPQRATPAHAALDMPRRLAAAARLAAELGLDRARPRRLVLIYSINPLTQRTYLALDAMWAPFGVRIEARGLESRAYSLALNAGDFDLMDYGPFSAVRSATSFIGRFQSGSFLNYSGYANAEVDRLIALAESRPDAAERARHYLDAERIVLRDWPVIPLYSGVTHRLVSPRVRGWVDNPGLALPSQYLALAD
ncbi:MAG: peptide ABC transporter substrate-binding protein [Gammaproteobacteria bacterium]|nr:peptide ABC transporter substrate-binding protein [Gammaproteobacteria bacterium]